MSNSPTFIEPDQNTQACVIFLHGLGADGHDLVPLVAQFSPQLRLSTRFIFPHAPHMAITVNNGMRMPAWYDIYSFDFSQQQDQHGIENSSQCLHQLIDSQISQGIAAQQIFVAGFSQGGAIALHAGLSFRQTLGGVLALSTYLPLAEQLDKYAHWANQHTPIFMAHGTHDPVVPLALSHTSFAQLKSSGYSVQWQTYSMGHSLCAAQINDIERWLNSLLV